MSLLLERGADPNRGNDYGWTKLHSAGCANDAALAGFCSARAPGRTCSLAATAARRWAHRHATGWGVPWLLSPARRVPQAGQREAVTILRELGADPLMLDRLHGGNALGWARVGSHQELADILS